MSRDTFGNRLFNLRMRAHLSVSAMAEAAGVDRMTVYRLEAGEREPSLATAQKLARALGTTLAAWEGCT
jgi:transcriptional regulator with XRE-family HTH domain